MNHGIFSAVGRLAMLCAAAITLQAQAELKVGDASPDWSMTGSDGKTYKLSDFKGKQAVVIAWFPKAFTGGCTKECTSLREDGAVIRKYDVAYFTASCDTVQLNTDFAKSLNLDYPILSDPTRQVAKEFGVVNETRLVPQRWTFFIGKDGKIQHISKKVNVSGHAQEIADQLEKLGVSKK